MPNMQKVLNEEIRRLARKEIKAAVAPLAQQNKVLKEQLAKQTKLVKELAKAVAAIPVQPKPAPAASADAKPAAKKGKRSFRPAILVAFRKKHSLSQRAVSQLLSTSLVSVTNWENGHAVPRPAMVEKIAALRKMGKRELVKLLPADAKKAGRKPRVAKKAKSAQPAAKLAAPAPAAPQAPEA